MRTALTYRFLSTASAFPADKALWPHPLAYITGRVDQELLLRNKYLAAENRILRAQEPDTPAPLKRIAMELHYSLVLHGKAE